MVLAFQKLSGWRIWVVLNYGTLAKLTQCSESHLTLAPRSVLIPLTPTSMAHSMPASRPTPVPWGNSRVLPPRVR